MSSPRAPALLGTPAPARGTGSPWMPQGERASRDVASGWQLRGGVVVALVAGLAATSGLDARGHLVLLVAAAGAVVFAAAEAPLGLILRQPAVAALGALALLELLSLAWTIGDVGTAARSAASALGVAALATAAAVVAQRRGGTEFLAGTIGVVAAVAAATGLGGVAAESTPFAECLSGVWRAGGPLEYPPALALVQVSAIPVALCWMCGARRGVAAGGVIVAALAASGIALSGSRTQIALAGLVVLWLVVQPGRLGASRGRLVAAVAAAAGAGVACAALARSGLGAPAVLAAVGVVAGALIGWRLLPRSRRMGIAVGATAVAGAAVLMVAVSARAPIACGTPPDGGFAHGRIALWTAGGQTALERPLIGAGAATFALATADRQGDDVVRFAHSQPIELAVELGALGLIAWLGVVGGIAHAIRRAWNSRALPLLAPAVVAFLLANLVDWPWHLVGSLAVWAVALGGLVGAGCRR